MIDSGLNHVRDFIWFNVDGLPFSELWWLGTFVHFSSFFFFLSSVVAWGWRRVLLFQPAFHHVIQAWLTSATFSCHLSILARFTLFECFYSWISFNIVVLTYKLLLGSYSCFQCYFLWVIDSWHLVFSVYCRESLQWKMALIGSCEKFVRLGF